MKFKNRFYPAKRSSMFLFMMFLSFSINKSFCQTQLLDTLYHPTIPKIDRFPGIEPVSELDDKGGNLMHRNIVGANTLDMYRNRRYDRIHAIFKVKNTTLLVVVDSDESAVSKALKQAFSVYWKFNNCKFIKPAEVPNYVGKDGYSFFMFVRDEHYITPTGQQVGANSWNPPHLFYHADTLQNVGKPGYFGHDAYASKYLFVITISNEKPGTDTKEDALTENMSIADYIIPSPDENYYYPNTGSLRQKERDMIPQFNTIVSNFQDDFEYIYKNNKVYAPVPVSVDKQLKRVHILYDSKDAKARTNITFYGNGEKLLKTKKILIDSSIADNMSVQFLSVIAEVATNQIQLVNTQVINEAIAKKDESVYYITKPCTDCGGLFAISDTYGRKLADFPGGIYALLSGSLLNPSALASLNANLFDKHIDSPDIRKKIKIETK